jgi:glycoside/pentoside/hexuronide:cation symporter, GPH family
MGVKVVRAVAWSQSAEMVAASAGRLSLANKLMYASDMAGSQAIALTKNLWLLFFLAPPENQGFTAAIPPLHWGPLALDPRVFAGFLLTAGRIIEAFDDPIIGWWSDRTSSRWGRRIPFILVSTPFYALFFSLLWLMPSSDASVINAVYVFLVLELFFLALTLSGSPYDALLPEIARTHRDRMSIVAWQFYFAILGSALGLVASGLVKDAFDFKVMGAFIAGLGLLFRYLGLAGVWRLASRETPPARVGLRMALKGTMSNRQFLYFLPTFVLFQAAVGMVIAWVPFFVAEVLGGSDQGRRTALLAGIALVAMLLSSLVLWRLGNAKGKRWVYSLSMLSAAVYLPLLFFAGFVPGVSNFIQGVAMACLAGLPMAGVNLLPRAITADITDYDALRTGMRREGMFYATQELFEKIGASVSPLLLSLVLLLGDTREDPLGLRLVGPVAGGITFLGFWIFRGYRLPSTVNRETVRTAGLEYGPIPPGRTGR